MDQTKISELKSFANKVRIGIIEAVYNAKSGHPGGSLSITDILTYMYNCEMRVDPENPQDPNRDTLVLSKGHTAPALYSVLANKGYFPIEDLKTLRHLDSYLQGHPDRNKIPGIDMSAGSLGQGVSVACGLALAAKIDGKDRRSYAILGDGESEEGQVWESAMFAAHYKLDNLCYILDLNGLQIDGTTDEVIGPNPLDEKFAAFGWNVIQCNAHDFNDIERAFKEARSYKGKPSIIIAHSIKGKGVSFMENSVDWHGKAPNQEQYEAALQELNAEKL